MIDELTLRPATREDEATILRWRNDPFVVARGSQRTVAPEEHARWLADTLARGDRALFIVTAAGEAIGLVRLDRRDDATAEAFAHVVDARTGEGLVARALAAGAARAFARWPIEQVVAYVGEDEAAGAAALRKAGFAPSASAPAATLALAGRRPFALRRPEAPAEWARDDARAVDYFTKLVEKHGVDVRSLDWGSKSSQELRFRVLSEVGPMDGASVLDIGCGLADMYGWLKSRGVNVRYTGVDLTPKMIELARARFPEARLEVGNVLDPSGPRLEPHDYVVASGIFFCRLSEPVEFVRRMVTRMFELATRAVAFNSLSAWSPHVDAEEYYADPLETVRLARTLTDRVVLRHEYHPRDFTVYLYKEPYART